MVVDYEQVRERGDTELGLELSKLELAAPVFAPVNRRHDVELD